MIQSSGRFSGGNSGGSNRTVVFTAMVDTKDARRELNAFAKDVENVNKKMTFGGRAGAAGPTGSGRPGVASGRPDLFYHIERQQLQERERMLERTAKRAGQLKSNFNELAEGVTSLGRAFVLLGVSTEESLQKAIKKLAVFEAAVAGARGSMKMFSALGGIVGVGGPAIAAGAVALGGLAIGGKAIQEQINYMRTGSTDGWVTRKTVGAYTGLYRALHSGGWNSEEMLARGGNDSLLEPYAKLAASQIRGERAFSRAARGTAEEIFKTQGSFDAEVAKYQQIAQMREAADALQRGAVSEREAAALNFYGMPAFDRQGMLRRRERVLADPTKASPQEMFGITPFVDPFQRGMLRQEFTRRATEDGLFGGKGWEQNWKDDVFGATGRAMADIALPQKREVVVKIVERQKEMLDQWESLMKQAIEESETEIIKEMEAVAEKIDEGKRRNNMTRQTWINLMSNALGGTDF